MDELLGELARRRWTVYLFGPKGAPELIAATFQWPTCADVLILRSQDRATAYRVPTSDDTDVFMPEIVFWQYHSDPEWTLRAVLTIGAPGHFDAPLAILQPHPLCRIPVAKRRPVTIRPAGLVPSPAPRQVR
ncbi:hypothetical protein P3102_22460 [Amycolatopsis sp. QT-25]|uniref:hypothetical protein n=1 Tax=Amycolatopsis sp. QT-25 TaxID=3034022 RepID=UPI0023ECE3BE|nr:hypothetical protein [Amycolatopsis sp. QT-25]WET76869.1 hypothetical protein P3102_22460 [Amycolatopsis sp. QT-25]